MYNFRQISATGKWGNFTDFSQYFRFFRVFFHVFQNFFLESPCLNVHKYNQYEISRNYFTIFQWGPSKVQIWKNWKMGQFRYLKNTRPFSEFFWPYQILNIFMTLQQLYMGSKTFGNEIGRVWKFPVWNR